MTPSAEAEVQAITCERFGDLALEWCRRLRALAQGNGPIAAELQDKFVPALRNIRKVSLENIEPKHGAFRIEGGQLTLAMEPVVRLLMVVVRDPRVGGLDADQVFPLLDKVLLVYFLHEVRHRSQGVGDYSDVQLIKEIAGRNCMSEIDVLADRDAAFAYGILQANGGTREDYLVSFQEAVWFSLTYYFKAFPLSRDRLDKVARICALYLMAARLAVSSLEARGETSDFPLDAPLQVRLNGHRGVAIFRAEPSLKLLAADNDAELIPMLLESVDNGKTDEAFEYASRAVIRFRLAA